jgi:sortase B
MKRKIPLIALCIFFAGMSVYYGLGLYRQWREYREGEQTYTQLTQYVQPQTPPAPTAQALSHMETHPLEETVPGEPEPTEEQDDTLWPVVDFEALCAINPDVVGWIFIDGTNINYPVVQGKDNSYYVYRLFDRSYNGAGSIFMDYRNEQDMSSRNTVLYGHHMQNGTMFNHIAKYKSQEFYDQHPTGLFMTPNGNYKIEFIAGYVTSLNGDAWKIEFASDEEFSLWLDNAIAQSTFTSTIEAAAEDRVVTLSTCSYEFADARYVLVGILK